MKYRIKFRDEINDRKYYVDVTSTGRLTVKDVGIVSGQDGLCVEGPISQIEIKKLEGRVKE